MLLFGVGLLPCAVWRRLRQRGAGRRLGVCPACSTSVFASDPHVRYRGDYWHAEPCVERGAGGPPALRFRRLDVG